MNRSFDEIVMRQSADAERIARATKRVCGDCQMCCEILGVPDVRKPSHTRCQHQGTGGCEIYGVRPVACREFACMWREGFGTEFMRPDLCGFMLWSVPNAELYEYVQGVLADPPVVLGVFAKSERAFRSKELAQVKRKAIEQRAALAEYHANYAVVYGLRFPRGTWLTLVRNGDDITILVPD